MTGRLSVVVGGLLGSEAKGHVASWLAIPERNRPDQHVVCVRVAGPNAGHSAVGCLDQKTWALRQVPIAVVTNLEATLVISAGSEVDFEVFDEELRTLDAAGYKASTRLLVDRAATVLTKAHREAEAGSDINKRLGSTAKGIGAARVDRLNRKANTVGQLVGAFGEDFPGVQVTDTARYLTDVLEAGAHVIVEGTQGYGLGLHTEYYPFTTSSDCRAIDFLAMAGLSPWGNLPSPEVWVVIRPYPIRVAGNSGPLKGETSWEALQLPEEKTTVTKRVRRVGTWDSELVRAAVRANGGNVKIAFSMMDQVVPEIAGYEGVLQGWSLPIEVADRVQSWINRAVEAAGDDSTVGWVGTGPGTCLYPAEVPVGADEAAGLSGWWVGKAREEAPEIARKATEYGSNSLAATGRMMASLQKREVSEAEALELGCFSYSYGKMERWLDSVQRGERPSDDTIHDISVYARMAERIRETGGWPGA